MDEKCTENQKKCNILELKRHKKNASLGVCGQEPSSF